MADSACEEEEEKKRKKGELDEVLEAVETLASGLHGAVIRWDWWPLGFAGTRSLLFPSPGGLLPRSREVLEWKEAFSRG